MIIIRKKFYRVDRVFMYGMKNRRLIEYLPLEIYAMPLNEHEQETCDLDYLGECEI